MAKREALIIATSEYSDPSLQELQSPAADAHSLAEVLSDANIGNFATTEILNRPSYEVVEAIDNFCADRTPEDLLLLYFSGHGIKDVGGRLFLASVNTKRTRLHSTAVDSVVVHEAMGRCRAKNQLLILDCCYGGAFGRNMTPKSDVSVNTSDYFGGTGRIILTATDATSYAMEMETGTVTGSGRRSVFTEVIVDGLRSGAADQNFDGLISPDDLFDYAEPRVLERTPNQRPMRWVLGGTGEIVLAHNPKPVVQPCELPPKLLDALDDSNLPGVRQGAVHDLGKLLNGRNRALRMAAELKLKELLEDDRHTVRQLARQYLDAVPPDASPKVAIPDVQASRQASGSELGELLAQLGDPRLSHARRAEIGDRVAQLGDPREGVGLRFDGLPDIKWVPVPGGEVTLNLADQEWCVAGIKPFQISQYPVTLQQFGAFTKPEIYNDARWWEGLPVDVAKMAPYPQTPAIANYPAQFVSWFEAMAFCRWLSDRLGCTVRLPAEWEWVQAATGGKPGYLYPWGSNWDPSRANHREGAGRLMSVGMYPNGKSPVGAYDMSGNMYEWCLGEFDNPMNLAPSKEPRTTRGGAFFTPPPVIPVQEQLSVRHRLRDNADGVRERGQRVAVCIRLVREYGPGEREP